MSRSDSLPIPPLPRRGASRTLVELPFLSLESTPLTLQNSYVHDHYTLKLGLHSVMVLASTSEGKWVINREYRPSTEQVLLSCPGGILDPGEEVIAAARRELLEETGYKAEEFRLLGSAYPFPGVCSQRTHFVTATGAYYAQPPQRDIEEFIATFELPLSELKHFIQTGIPVDSNLCSALFWLSESE